MKKLKPCKNRIVKGEDGTCKKDFGFCTMCVEKDPECKGEEDEAKRDIR